MFPLSECEQDVNHLAGVVVQGKVLEDVFFQLVECFRIKLVCLSKCNRYSLIVLRVYFPDGQPNDSFDSLVNVPSGSVREGFHCEHTFPEVGVPLILEYLLLHQFPEFFVFDSELFEAEGIGSDIRVEVMVTFPKTSLDVRDQFGEIVVHLNCPCLVE